jgi:23S rRNA (uridine2552-2'-O)-methyltransferase
VRVLNDYWSRQAKQEGYPARSVYKLQEIDEKFHILKGAERVLDVGAAPGSWTLYLLRHLSSSAQIVSVDIQPLTLEIASSGGNRVTFIQGDITDPKIIQRLTDLGPYDGILSDAAPSTTGIRTVDTARSEALVEGVISFLPSLLKKGGFCVVKIFKGPEGERIFQKLKPLFSKVKAFKPRACRSESFEVYYIGMGK